MGHDVMNLGPGEICTAAIVCFEVANEAEQ